MKQLLPLVAFLAGCSKPTQHVPLPKQDAAQIMEWNTIVNAMRMDVLDKKGNVVKQRVLLEQALRPGQPTVVALWATYCPPCLEEMEMLGELAEDGHQIIGVSLDSDNHADVAKVLAQKSPKYPQAVLQNASVKRIGLSLKSGLPFTMVLNRRGEVRYVFSGKTSKDELVTALERLGS